MKVAFYHGQLVQASRCRLTGPFICPDCGKAVNLVHGPRKRAYFAHRREADCYSHGETDLHQLGKEQMCSWSSRMGWEPQMEVFLPNVRQRPDLMIQIDGEKFVLEYQCSPLGIKRLIERNQGYRHLRLPFCWFLGPRYQKHLHKSKIAQFTQWHQGQPTLPFWDLRQGQPIFKTDYQRIPFIRAVSAIPWTVFIQQTLALQRLMIVNDYQWRKLNQLCYLHHHLLSACPLVAHPTKAQWPIIAGGEFQWRLKCMLLFDRLQLGATATAGQWKKLFAQQAIWLPTPCLSVTHTLALRSRPIDQLIADLVAAKILQKNGSTLVYVKAPSWFVDGDRKLKYLMTSQQ